MLPESRLIPLFEYEGRGWTPLGLPMSQNRLAVPTWSYAMEKHPPKTIVEIGTNNGGFTIALGIHAWRIGTAVHTFDLNEAPTNAFAPLTNLLPITFYKADCFAPETVALIANLIRSPGIVYVFCDGGDKPREFAMFSEYLKPGDVIAGHDYSVKEEWWPWREITQEQVEPYVSARGLTPFMQEHFDMAGWMVYRKA
jgi:cephalosporin hydroxylase